MRGLHARAATVHAVGPAKKARLAESCMQLALPTRCDKAATIVVVIFRPAHPAHGLLLLTELRAADGLLLRLSSSLRAVRAAVAACNRHWGPVS